MEKLKENKLVVASYVSLAIAIFSVFTTIIGYTNESGVHRTFSLRDFLASNGNDFDSFVSWEYTGTVYWNIDIGIIRVFAVIGIIAVVCAIVGVSMVSKQKENAGSFALALIGLLGTMAPSVLILICVVIMRNSYMGTISCGIYPIVSPIAMIVCIIATTQMHRRNIEYRKKLKDAEGLIFRGEDL